MLAGPCQERLYLRLPQTMEIAVGIYGNCLVIIQAEGDIGLFAGLEILALTAGFGLECSVAATEVSNRHKSLDNLLQERLRSKASVT